MGQLSAPQPLLRSQELSAPNVHTAEVEKFASFFSFPSVLWLPSLFVSAFFSLALIISICFHVWLSLTRNCTFCEELIVWFTYVSAACRTIPDTVVCARSVVSDSAPPWPEPTRLLCPWDFSGKNTGVSCSFLLQGIEPKSPVSPTLQADSLPAQPLGKMGMVGAY